MDTMSSRMAEFLESFERSRTEGADVTNLFAETFLAGGPDGARCVRAEDFVKALPRRKEMFERAGCRRTRLAGVTETPLDARYTMARTKWQMTFEREGEGEKVIEVESTFIVDMGGPAPRIVAYLAHQDALNAANRTWQPKSTDGHG